MSTIAPNHTRNRSGCSDRFDFAFIAHLEMARFRLEARATLHSKATQNAFLLPDISFLCSNKRKFSQMRTNTAQTLLSSEPIEAPALPGSTSTAAWWYSSKAPETSSSNSSFPAQFVSSHFKASSNSAP